GTSRTSRWARSSFCPGISSPASLASYPLVRTASMSRRAFKPLPITSARPVARLTEASETPVTPRSVPSIVETQEAQCIPSTARATRVVAGGNTIGRESGGTPGLTGGLRRKDDPAGALISKRGIGFLPLTDGGGWGEGARFAAA